MTCTLCNGTGSRRQTWGWRRLVQCECRRPLVSPRRGPYVRTLADVETTNPQTR